MLPLIDLSCKGGISFATFYTQHFPSVHQMAVLLTREAELAADITQDVFTRLCEKWDSMGPVQNWNNYLYILVRNRYLSVVRRKKSWAFFVAEVYRQAPPTSLVDYELKDNRVRLRKAIQRLPERQRLVVTLRCEYGYRTREIAETLGVAPNTVKCQLQQATLKLKVYIVQAA